MVIVVVNRHYDLGSNSFNILRAADTLRKGKNLTILPLSMYK